jgi:hypothetical protein
MTPDALLATLAGLSHDDHPARLVATVATVCPDCGEDYDEVGATARCRDRHELRLTSAQRELYYRGLRADAEARKGLTRAKRAAKAGDWTRAQKELGAIPRHDWGLSMVNRLRVAACSTCAAVVLVGDEDDRIAGAVRADPWKLSNDGEVAAILLDRPTWRLWGAWPSYRAVERLGGLGAPGTPPGPPAAACVVVAGHVCGTRLDGEPIAAAIARSRTPEEIPF